MKQSQSIPQKQAAILSYLFDHLPIGDQVSTLDFSLTDSSISRCYAAYARIVDAEDELYAVFNLPGDTGAVFLGLAYANAPEVARVLANLEEFEAANQKQLNWGGVLSIGNAATSVLPGVALLRTASADEFRDVPDRAVVQGQELRFFLVAPLDANELSHRQRLGHDALMDKFAAESKDIVFDI